MAEVKYESKITSSSASAESIYRVLSDLSNLERVRDLIPRDKIQEMEFASDFARFKVDGLGQKIGVRIVDKADNDFVKYGIENAPVDGNLWIQLKQVAPTDTRIRLTIKADFPLMFKMMLDKKLQEGLDQAADMLARMPFQQWN